MLIVIHIKFEAFRVHKVFMLQQRIFCPTKPKNGFEDISDPLHTEPLPQQPRQGLLPLQQPTEPPHSLCLIRACSLPSSTQSTLIFPMLYIKTEKKK